MKIKNLKQVDLVKKTNIGKSAISQYISGYCIPKDDKIDILSKVLNVDEKWLRGYDVPMKPRILNTDELVEKFKDYIMTDDEIYNMNQREDELTVKILVEKIKNSTPLQIFDLNQRFDEIKTIDNEDWDLLISFNQLNKLGKKKLLDYAKDLNKIIDYYEDKEI
jgi:Helix-turn-helix.